MKLKALSQLAIKQGFKLGDDIVSIGGYKVIDELDFLYYDNESKFDVELIREGKEIKIKVSKKPFDSLGFEFDYEMKPYVCKNHCLFCFVDQLPKGMRETLYVKDDDYRYSFMCGSYVTMTNVTDEELDRIIRLKLSPLYISVHAWDDDVRQFLVKNPNTKKLKDQMRKLNDAGIKMHTQLVVCPGINDGKVLVDSINGLHELENVISCAVVPVGLTGHRGSLADIKPVDVDNAKETIKLVEDLHKKYEGFCYCADEYYVKAGVDVKDYFYYGAFDQIENGVGLLATFKDNLEYQLENAKDKDVNKSIGFITGASFAPILREQLRAVEERFNIKATVYGIENNFFGKSVTVAGLITARDILEQVDGKHDFYVLPDNMLREFTDTFLDNYKVKDVEEKLGAKIIIVAHDGSDILNKIIG